VVFEAPRCRELRYFLLSYAIFMAASFLCPVTSSLLIMYQVYADDLTADTVSAGQGPRLRPRLPNYSESYNPALQQTSPSCCILHIWHSLTCRGPRLVGSSLGSCELLAILAEYLGATTQADLAESRKDTEKAYCMDVFVRSHGSLCCAEKQEPSLNLLSLIKLYLS
jgi:hypothetical protein